MGYRGSLGSKLEELKKFVVICEDIFAKSCDMYFFDGWLQYLCIPSSPLAWLINRQEHMAKSKAADDTITRLFTVYLKQGMQKHKAIMLIAASLGLLQKDVLEALEQKGVYDDCTK